ncbi:MAG: hypothetical protein QOE70_4309 [Chthoniobacter sp.]|jgi:arylsulfatase A-like enzyme|nr:hypothetical protein [Chthoniobacter sp.]
MKRRLLAVVAFLLCALGGSAHAESAPHIVFLLTDDLGPGDLGCYGGTIAATPNIDRLAKEGTRFTRYYSASPICSPSRCGLITGNFPARWNVTSFMQTRAGNRECEQVDFLDPKAPSLPRQLKAAGYATAHIGKWHLGGGRDVIDAPKFAAYGYDEGLGTYESPEPYPDITTKDWIWSPQDRVKRWERTAFFVDKTLDFIARHPAQPCFVNLWLDDPHTPWVPSAQAGQGDTLEKLKAVMEENDQQIGRLMDALPANTLLIFASDNGPLPTFEQKRALGLRGSKLSLYEGGIRLPFIARWPGRVPAGRVDETSVIAAVDLLPTLCAIAGAKLPEGAAGDGTDVSQTLRGETLTRTRPLFWEYGRNDKSFKFPGPRNRSPSVAMLDGPWKLLVNADGTGAELYAIFTDPKETKNLAEEQPDLTAKLKAAALSWRTGLPHLPPAK